VWVLTARSSAPGALLEVVGNGHPEVHPPADQSSSCEACPPPRASGSSFRIESRGFRPAQVGTCVTATTSPKRARAWVIRETQKLCLRETLSSETRGERIQAALIQSERGRDKTFLHF